MVLWQDFLDYIDGTSMGVDTQQCVMNVRLLLPDENFVPATEITGETLRAVLRKAAQTARGPKINQWLLEDLSLFMDFCMDRGVFMPYAASVKHGEEENGQAVRPSNADAAEVGSARRTL